MRNNRYARSRGRFCCNPGSPMHELRSPEVLDDGTIRLTVTGVENTDEIIEAQRGSTDLAQIIARYNAGDVSVLSRSVPSYLDLTEMPKTMAEAMQSLINAERYFDTLPVSVKKEFDSDWHKFVASAGSDAWFKALGVDPSSPAAPETPVPDSSPAE